MMSGTVLLVFIGIGVLSIGVLGICGLAVFNRRPTRFRQSKYPPEHWADMIVGHTMNVDRKPVRRFKIEGKVVKDSEAGTQVLAHTGCIREAESAEAVKAAWLHDMKIAYPIGPDYNVDYWCEVTPLDDESDDDSVKATIAAEVATARMF